MESTRRIVTLTGEVSDSPVIRATTAGRFSATFGLTSTIRTPNRHRALTLRSKRHVVVAYDNLAIKIRNEVQKGAGLCIEGEFELREWMVKGEKKYLSQVVLSSLKFVSAEQPLQHRLPLAA